jgi:hypothetical protein
MDAKAEPRCSLAITARAMTADTTFGGIVFAPAGRRVVQCPWPLQDGVTYEQVS